MDRAQPLRDRDARSGRQGGLRLITNLFPIIVLLALPVAGWSVGRPFNPIDIVVGGVGIGALLVAVDGFLRHRELARHEPKRAARPRSSAPLAEGR